MAKKRPNVISKASKQAAWETRKRRQHASAMELMGIAQLYKELPNNAQEHLWRRRLPDPVVEIEPGSRGHPHAAAVQKELQAMLQRATVTLTTANATKPEFPLCDVYTICTFTRNCLKEWKDGPLRACKAAAEAWRRADRFVETAMPLLHKKLYQCVMKEGARHSRMDRFLFKGCLVLEPVQGGEHLKAVFGLETPQRADAALDGKSRPVFRCGAASTAGPTIDWLSWRGSDIGLPEDPTLYPVYIQSHALLRLQERLKEIPSQWHYDLYRSVRDVKLVEAARGDLLIEFRVNKQRLGYLVARKTGDAIVITTFLFITMQGTPEARMLAEKLRLRRNDIQYEGLDQLSTFIVTDLHKDPLLVRLLKECGCGHLLSVGTPKGEYTTGFARELSQYLRLDDKSHHDRFLDRLEGMKRAPETET